MHGGSNSQCHHGFGIPRLQGRSGPDRHPSTQGPTGQVGPAGPSGPAGASGVTGGSGPAGPTGPSAPGSNILAKWQDLPGAVATITAVTGASGADGTFQVGDTVSVAFTLKNQAGKDLLPSE